MQLRFAEMLEPDGTLHLANLRAARPLDTYVLARRAASRTSSRGSPSTASATSRSPGSRRADARGVTGIVVHTDMPRTGAFECSSELVNQLWRNIVWGQRGNFLSVPTDCPQRDERLGWMGDAQVFLRTAA